MNVRMQSAAMLTLALAGAVGLLTDSIAAAPAAENQVKKAKQRAKEFLTTLKKGDAKGLKGFYAPKVLVKGGSELLKAQWGLNPGGDRSKDLEVERDKLLEGYAKLFAQVGNKWSDVWARILKEEAGRVTFSKAMKDDEPFGGVKKDDVVVRVSTGVGDDTFHYVLRADAQGQWWIVVESADY